MKITDLFSRIHKSNMGQDGVKGTRLIPPVEPVQPVGHIGRLNLLPGQLLHGEVVGEDADGLLLVKLAGEIIAARSVVKLEVGQQFWFEVKEAGDSPLLSLATRKGAIQDLLKNIMATRPLLIKSPDAAFPSPAASAGQATTLPGSAAEGGAVQGQPAAGGGGPVPARQAGGPAMVSSVVVGADGALPSEAARLIKALVASLSPPAAAGGALAAGREIEPLPGLMKTITILIREGRIPSSLQKLAAFQTVVQPDRAGGVEVQGAGAARAGVEVSAAQTPGGEAGGARQTVAPAGSALLSSAVLAPATIRILNALMAVSGLKPSLAGDATPPQPALNPEQNLTEILTLIARENKIPLALQRLAPLQMLMGNGSAAPVSTKEPLSEGGAWQKGAAGQGQSPFMTFLPLQFAAAQQGTESLPAQLRLLASLVGLGTGPTDQEGWQEIDKIFVRLSAGEKSAVAHRLSSFFEAHARLNTEAAPQTQSDFYIVPSLFTGQTGWGEWLWSRDKAGQGSDGDGQENLVFFLEMSNLGPITIQVTLRGKQIQGSIIMADQKGSEVVTTLMPGLRSRLEALGYELLDFPCSCRPLNLMQELKEGLHGRRDSGVVSLLDVQV